MAKKKKKKKQRTKPKEVSQIQEIDLGAQTLIRENGKIYRLPDMAEMQISHKHISKKINSVHESYYARHQLDPTDAKNNATRFVAGQKLEYLAIISNKNKSCTMNFSSLAGIPHGSEFFDILKIDYGQEFNDAMKATLQHQSLLWDVIVDNKPATHRRMDKYREALDMLISYWKM
jgi:hypothetical protein